MSELLAQVPLDLVCVGALAALALRRLVRVDGHHELRVALLTGLLWVPVIYLFISVLTCLLPTGCCYCTPPAEPNVYTITET